MERHKVQVIAYYISKAQEKVFLALKTNIERGGFWQNITGHVDSGESLSAAAMRELFEETGIHREQLCRFEALDLEFRFHDRWGYDCIESCFAAQILARPGVQISDEEHQDYKWVKASDLTPALYKYPNNFEAINSVMAL